MILFKVYIAILAVFVKHFLIMQENIIFLFLLIFLQLFTLVVGHTKFPPDLHLGIQKIAWNRTTVESMPELCDCVRQSSKGNIPVNVDAVTFYDWKEFLNRVGSK